MRTVIVVRKKHKEGCASPSIPATLHDSSLSDAPEALPGNAEVESVRSSEPSGLERGDSRSTVPADLPTEVSDVEVFVPEHRNAGSNNDDKPWESDYYQSWDYYNWNTGYYGYHGWNYHNNYREWAFQTPDCWTRYRTQSPHSSVSSQEIDGAQQLLRASTGELRNMKSFEDASPAGLDSQPSNAAQATSPETSPANEARKTDGAESGKNVSGKADAVDSVENGKGVAEKESKKDEKTQSTESSDKDQKKEDSKSEPKNEKETAGEMTEKEKKKKEELDKRKAAAHARYMRYYRNIRSWTPSFEQSPVTMQIIFWICSHMLESTVCKKCTQVQILPKRLGPWLLKQQVAT